MTAALALLTLAAVVLVCAAAVYVARLHYADRADARTQRAVHSTEEVSRLRSDVDSLTKLVHEQRSTLAAITGRGVRR